MKKKIVYLTFSLFFLYLTFLILKPLFYKNYLPNVSYFALNDEKVNLKEIELSKKETLIYYVNPTCNSCIKINDSLVKVNRNLSNVIIICSFINETNYSLYKNKFLLQPQDIFLIDKYNTFTFDFNIGFSYSLPIFIQFDKKGKRVI